MCIQQLISSDPMFAKLGSLKVFDIYQFQVSKFIFKCINKIAPVNFQNWFSINHESYCCCTRSTIKIMGGKKTNNLFIPTARTSNYGMKLLNTYWATSSPISEVSMLPYTIVGDGEAGAHYWIRKHTNF